MEYTTGSINKCRALSASKKCRVPWVGLLFFIVLHNHGILELGRIWELILPHPHFAKEQRSRKLGDVPLRDKASSGTRVFNLLAVPLQQEFSVWSRVSQEPPYPLRRLWSQSYFHPQMLFVLFTLILSQHTVELPRGCMAYGTAMEWMQKPRWDSSDFWLLDIKKICKNVKWYQASVTFLCFGE